MRGRFLLTSVLTVACTLPATAQQRAAPDRLDIVITGGLVIDGSGNPAYRADVGIRDGHIVAVGLLAGQPAGRVIDAKGRVVAPGFIDLHSHGDGDSPMQRRNLRDEDARRRAAPNLVTQGITTVVVNQDGRSAVWPISQQRAELERKRTGVNTALLVGHGEVRRRVLGNDFRRAATAEETQRMRALVRQAMQEGALGMSAGLEYTPGRYSTTDEVVALVEEIVPFGGVYIAHERSEGSDPMWYWPSQDEPGPPTLLDAVHETIEIGERTGATVVASHIKAKGAHYWGSGRAAIQLIEQARARGVQVYADQYPYDTSGSDGSTVLIPDWAIESDARDADRAPLLRKVLADSVAARKLRQDIEHEIRRRGGAERIIVFDYPDKAYVGKTLAEIAAMRKQTPLQTAIALQLEGYSNRPGGARMRGFSLSEIDIELYAGRPWVATATDGGVALPTDGPAVHARFYGTFPRKIGYYARERGVLSVEDAVRSSTSLPAQILGLRDRGMIREGMHADVVVFDAQRIRDKATFFEPHQYSTGIDYVLVNGVPVVERGQPTWALPGRVIMKTAPTAGRVISDGGTR